MDKLRLSDHYMRLVTVAGAAAFAYSAWRFDRSVVDLQFLLIFSFAAAVGSRMSVSIPKTQAVINASDSLVFLTMLLYGGDAAVVLAGAEAFCSSSRLTRKWSTRFFNAGLLALSTSAAVFALRLCFGRIRDVPAGEFGPHAVAAVLVMASVQCAANSGLALLRDRIRSGRAAWRTWRAALPWTSITYFAAASAAALIARASVVVGPRAFAAALPFVLVIYFTHRTYRKNIVSAERFARELGESEARFRGAFDNAAIGMTLVGLDGRWLRVNDSFCRLVGYSPHELLRMHYREITHADDLAENEALARRLLAGELPSFHTEKRYLHRGGSVVWTVLSVSLVRDGAGAPAHFITQAQDITDRKRAEEQLVHGALHDALTGLPNRALFMELLRQSVERARRRADHPFAVLFLDFDRFKVVNDSLGHHAGDQLLVEIAARLRASVRACDTVARLGGDEFTVLLDGASHPRDTLAVIARIREAVERPFLIGGHEVYTSASIGVAPSAVSCGSAEEIVRNADTAMYRAKQSGKARHVVFDPAMHSAAVELLSLETDLHKAVERGELRLHYQPVVSLGGAGRLLGFEALVRWQHPRRGLMQPAEFVPLAEEMGIILRLGDWVQAEACRQMRAWRDRWAAAHELYVSVNLSGRQFTQPDMVGRVVSAAHAAGLPLRSLKLEVTESVLMSNLDTAAAKLAQLRQLGVEIAIDDFGTGYSSLSRLHKLPIDTLKIDRSFVSLMSGEDENTEIVRTIITLGRSLGMRVVAEGVETATQKSVLRALGCDAAQGYLFSKPLDAEAAERLLPKEWPCQKVGDVAGVTAA